MATLMAASCLYMNAVKVQVLAPHVSILTSREALALQYFLFPLLLHLNKDKKLSQEQ